MSEQIGQVGIHSPFREDEFKKVDPIARELIINHFKFKGIEVINNPDQYGPDLYIPSLNVFVEVAIKVENWHVGSSKFPFDSLSVENRKEKYKFAKDGSERVVWYFYISGDHQWAIYTHGKNLKREYLLQKRNYRHQSGEYFFHVPIEFCKVGKILTEPIKQETSDILN